MRLNFKLVFLLLFLVLLGVHFCRKAGPEAPLTEDELVPILIDLHLAEAGLQNLYGITKDSMRSVYTEQIFAIHEIDSAILDSTLMTYLKDAEGLAALYEKVLKGLERAEEGEN